MTVDSYQSAECGGAPVLRRLSCSPVAVCVYTWMKHQLAIYSNNQADGVTSCLCPGSVAAPAEATRLQPVGEGGFRRCHSLGVPPASPCSIRVLQQVGATLKPRPPLCHQPPLRSRGGMVLWRFEGGLRRENLLALSSVL